MKRTGKKMSSSFKRFLITVVFLALAVGLAACSASPGQQAPSNGGKIRVTATIGMITDVVRNVGGDHVEATGLMGPGVDPHLYKASQGDIKKLDDAQIIFYNGLHLEGKMVDILEKLADKKPTVAVSRAIDTSKLRSGEDAGGTEYDPHIWFNVQHWISATEQIRDALADLDREHADDYRNHAEAYIAQLQDLDQEIRGRIAAIPEQSRVLVTAHDAFGYFGEAYGMKVMGLQGMSTASEYGSKDVSDLRDFLVENNIKAVFIESSVPAKSIEAVIAGAREKGHEVVIGGELFSDAMGPEGTVEGTYIGMVRHNVETIVNALK